MDLNASLKVQTMKKGQIRKVYRGWLRWDFPPAERRPLRRVLKFVSQGKYECLGLWRGEEQVGYAFLALDGRGGALLDYYAMAPTCRGKGYWRKWKAWKKPLAKKRNFCAAVGWNFTSGWGWRIPAFAVCFMGFPMKSCGSRGVGGRRSFSAIWMDFTGS